MRNPFKSRRAKGELALQDALEQQRCLRAYHRRRVRRAVKSQTSFPDPDPGPGRARMRKATSDTQVALKRQQCCMVLGELELVDGKLVESPKARSMSTKRLLAQVNRLVADRQRRARSKPATPNADAQEAKAESEWETRLDQAAQYIESKERGRA